MLLFFFFFLTKQAYICFRLVFIYWCPLLVVLIGFACILYVFPVIELDKFSSGEHLLFSNSYPQDNMTFWSYKWDVTCSLFRASFKTQRFGILICVGPRKLFTTEEKFLLNKRHPDLVPATSVSSCLMCSLIYWCLWNVFICFLLYWLFSLMHCVEADHFTLFYFYIFVPVQACFNLQCTLC